MHCRIRTVGTVQPRSHCDRWGARARLVCSDAGWLHTMPPAETHDLQAVTVCSEAVRSPGRRRRSAGVVQPVAVGHYLPLSRVTSAAGQGRLLSLTTVKFLRPRGREADTRSAPTPGVRLGAEFYGLTERVVAGTSATVSCPVMSLSSRPRLSTAPDSGPLLRLRAWHRARTCAPSVAATRPSMGGSPRGYWRSAETYPPDRAPADHPRPWNAW